MKLPKDLLAVYHNLHTWVGISAGMLLFIGFYAGALTMFEQPLDRWSSMPEQRLSWLDTARRDQLVTQLLEQTPQARTGFTLYLQDQPNITAPLVWQDEDHGAELLSGKRWHASLNSADELQVEQITPSRLGELIDQLHRTAGIPGVVDDEFLGVYILGIAALLYFLALVSGLIILLPTLVRNFVALRPEKSPKVFWRDAHNLIGITSMPFHLVISLSVVVFAFHDQFYGALKDAVYAEQPMFSRAQTAAPVARSVTELLPASELVSRIETFAPEYEVTELLYMRLESAAPMVRAAVVNPTQVVHGPLAGYLGIHPYTGDILMTDMLPETAGGWSTAVTSFFALHFGSYGGNTVRWLYFLLGLSGAFLFYSGNLLWLEARRKPQRRNATPQPQLRAVRYMAAATVGVCLGSILATTLTLVSARWQAGLSENINSAYLITYYSAFLLALGWAFWCGAAKAAPQLLMACSLAMLAIPLTSVLALLPAAGIAPHSGGDALMVDLSALVLAAITAWAARLSWRRAYQGEPGSVWAVAARVPAAQREVAQ